MPRKARVVAVGVPHHVTQRGNNRQDIFLSDNDRTIYLERLKQDCHDCGVRLPGYRLMTNHVHLVAVPERVESLGKALRRTHSSYAQSFNRRYRQSGHLWQNRFFSCPLGWDHLMAALRYVDLNPVRAGLVESACEYRWSSAKAHASGSDHELIDAELWQELGCGGAWEAGLHQAPNRVEESRLRRNTLMGIPHGNDDFVRNLEKTVGRSLRPSKPGPKPKVLAIGVLLKRREEKG